MSGTMLTLLPVDGGHRAIKYTRIGGVQKEIFNEGKMMGCAHILEEHTNAEQELISRSPGSKHPSPTMYAQNLAMLPPLPVQKISKWSTSPAVFFPVPVSMLYLRYTVPLALTTMSEFYRRLSTRSLKV